jgi:protein-disulfide isomerase
MSRDIRGPIATVLFAALAVGCGDGKANAAAKAPGEDSAAQQAQPTGAAPSTAPTIDERVQRADAARIKGDPSVKHWVVVVSDFQCPYCRTWHDRTAAQLEAEYVATGKVRLAYVHFPLGQHQHARPAAEASMCAGAQGKFWEMHDRLFATVDVWSTLPASEEHFARLAREIGLDVAAYGLCMRDDVMLPMIQADHDRSVSAGVNSTPSFIIGDQILSGAQPIEQFRPAIEKMLAGSK